MEKPKLTIVTNVCSTDDIRFKPVICSWLRVFGSRVHKVIIVVDPAQPRGRIAQLHGDAGSLSNVLNTIQAISQQDSRIKSVLLPDSDHIKEILKDWFVGETPHKCQDGTPVLPLVFAMIQGEGELVLRADCDMVFHEAGFIDNAFNQIMNHGVDIVEPYRWLPLNDVHISTRAFLFHPEKFKKQCLPLHHAKLDLLRSFHRRLTGRSVILALEQSLTKEAEKGGIKHLVLAKEYGFSLHFGKRSDFLLPDIDTIIQRTESGVVPARQYGTHGNFSPDAWS